VAWLRWAAGAAAVAVLAGSVTDCDSDTSTTEASSGNGGNGGCLEQPPPHAHVIVEVRAEDDMPLPDDTVLEFEFSMVVDHCIFDFAAMDEWKTLATGGNIECEVSPAEGPPFTAVTCELWTTAVTMDVTAMGYDPMHREYPYETDTCGFPPPTETKKEVLNLEGTGGTGGNG
jgi:hypothetical protein